MGVLSYGVFVLHSREPTCKKTWMISHVPCVLHGHPRVVARNTVLVIDRILPTMHDLLAITKLYCVVKIYLLLNKGQRQISLSAQYINVIKKTYDYCEIPVISEFDWKYKSMWIILTTEQISYNTFNRINEIKGWC